LKITITFKGFILFFKFFWFEIMRHGRSFENRSFEFLSKTG
jgi:hypothetical protein